MNLSTGHHKIILKDIENRKFYTGMIMNCAKCLPDEKLKDVAEIVMKITDIAE